MYWLCSWENCACKCAGFASSVKITVCATANFSVASSSNWLNFIISIDSVQSHCLYMPSGCSVMSAWVIQFSISSGVKLLTCFCALIG